MPGSIAGETMRAVDKTAKDATRDVNKSGRCYKGGK